MDSTSPDTRTLCPLPPVSHHGTRYEAETRELAYQLYAFKHGRNAEAVARELGVVDGKCPGLEGRTVRRWAVERGWAACSDREIRELAPAIHASNVTSLIAGAPEAIQALREVARGEGDPLTMGHRVKAAVAILDRTGYPATVAVTPPGNHGTPEPTDLSALTLAEIIERQRQLLEQGA